MHIAIEHLFDLLQNMYFIWSRKKPHKKPPAGAFCERETRVAQRAESLFFEVVVEIYMG